MAGFSGAVGRAHSDTEWKAKPAQEDRKRTGLDEPRYSASICLLGAIDVIVYEFRQRSAGGRIGLLCRKAEGKQANYAQFTRKAKQLAKWLLLKGACPAGAQTESVGLEHQLHSGESHIGVTEGRIVLAAEGKEQRGSFHVGPADDIGCGIPGDLAAELWIADDDEAPGLAVAS
jgi:hypothetical protein